jgi:hypothetical protein
LPIYFALPGGKKSTYVTMCRWKELLMRSK